MRHPHPNTLTPEQRDQRRRQFAGEGATRHDAGCGDESCYFTLDTPGRFRLSAFRGKALRPAMYYSFRSPEHRASYIERFMGDAKATAERQAQRRRAHTLQAGDVLYASWGYEQSNVEFYEVRAVRGAVVDLQQLAEDRTSDGPQTLTGRKTPRPGQYVGELLKSKRPNGNNAVRLNSYITASPWEGRPMFWSDYA